MFATLSEIELVAKWVIQNIPDKDRTKLEQFLILGAENYAASTSTPIDDEVVHALASIAAQHFDGDSIKRAVVGVLEELAAQTASPIDDDIVSIVAHALGVQVSQ